MDQQEMVEALIKEAILNVNPATGEAKINVLDDVSPGVRECIRATKEHDWDHQQRCPDCLVDEAEAILIDAASHREDGNEATALELEDEAGEALTRAVRLREGKET